MKKEDKRVAEQEVLIAEIAAYVSVRRAMGLSKV